MTAGLPERVAEPLDAPRESRGESRGRHLPPGPSGLETLRALREVRRDKLGFVEGLVEAHGDLVAWRMGPRRRFFLLNRHELVRQVLRDRAGRYRRGIGLGDLTPLLGAGVLTSDSALGHEQRTCLATALGRERLGGFVREMTAAVRAALARWEKSAAADRGIDLAREAPALALDVLGRTLFGSDLAPSAPTITASFDTLARWAIRRSSAVVRFPPTFPSPANLRCREAGRRLHGVVAERLAGTAGEALAPLLGGEARTPEDARRRRDEVIELLLAGHETTASAMCWTLGLVAGDPAARRIVEEECREVLDGRDPEPADVPRLVRTLAVIKEALRLYPPVWMITRRAVEDDLLGGFAVPAGSQILISVYTLQRHPALWEAPARFRPERFLASGARELPSCAYLPFGSGDRSCVGSAFALMELTIVLALLVQARRIELAAPALPRPEPLLTLRPSGPLVLRLRPRRSRSVRR